MLPKLFLALLPYLQSLLLALVVVEGRLVSLNVVDFGAIGDGRDFLQDSTAIQAALERARQIQQQGSTVVVVSFPAGYTFLSAPIHIDNMTGLVIQVDGVLRAMTNDTNSDWEMHWPTIGPLTSYGNSRDGGHFQQYQPFLYITNSVDIIIRGTGTIDGGGSWWWWNFQHSPSQLTAGRPNLIRLVNCRDVEITGVTLQDSAFWTLHPVYSQNIHIHHIEIRAPLYAPNIDGIDPDSCHNVTIEYNDISCGDDHIAIKAGVCGDSSPNHCTDSEWLDGTYETSGIVVRHNVFRTGMGVAIGSEMSGGVRHVQIYNNSIGVCEEGHEPPLGCGWSHALHMKTTVSRGGSMSFIEWKDNRIYNTLGLLLMETDYQSSSQPPTDYPVTQIHDILFDGNVGLGSASHATFGCSEDIICQNITVRGNRIPRDETSSWTCSFVDTYVAYNNSPPGVEQCLEDSMHGVSTTKPFPEITKQ